MCVCVERLHKGLLRGFFLNRRRLSPWHLNSVKAEWIYPLASERGGVWECVPFCLSFPFWPAKLQERFPCHDSSPLTLLLVALRARLCSPPRSFICVWWLWEKSAVPLPSGCRNENHSALSEMTGDFPKMTASSGSETAASCVCCLFARVLIFVSCLCSRVPSL